MKMGKMAVAGMLMAAGVVGTSMAQTNETPAFTQSPVKKSWTDAITLKGDLRYRYERINDDAKLNSDKETYTRQRDRIRARIGAEAKCNDNLKAAIGLTTDEGNGSGDPISGNQTLTGGESKKLFFLDYAYLDYSFLGEDPNEVHAIGGKMKNPFITMPDDLVWDPDLTPEGLALKGALNGDFATLMGNAGYIWVQERSGSPSAMLYAGQVALKLQFSPEVAFTIGGSYYDFQNFQGKDLIDYQTPASSYGNSTINGSVSGSMTNKAWASGFTPVVGFAQLEMWVAGMPVTVFAQEINNGDADNFNQGQMIGASLGKAKNPQTWEAGYSYTKLEKDATLGMFTDSDRWGGGTDGKGSKVYAKYQIMKNLQAAVTYFMDDKTISDAAKTKDYNRLQVDLVAMF